MVQVGVGAMGRTWLDAIARHPDAELAGIVDLDRTALAQAATVHDLPTNATATSLAELDVAADAVVNVTVPAAHLPVSVAALRAGLPVLCEKPAAPTVADALRMAAASRATGCLLVVSQSRRFLRGVAAIRRVLPDLGAISSVSCAFHRAPRFGGFREEMAHPLLVDMAIHHLDLARLLVDDRPATVQATSWNPPWSWFAGDAAADVVVTFAAGARFDYAGSWVARGAQGSWNGSWRISAEHGSVTWDGEDAPEVVTADGERVVPTLGDEPEEVDGSLAAFLALVRGETGSEDAGRGVVPASDIDDNVTSLAMVAAAVTAADTSRPVDVADLLSRSRAEALVTEPDPALRAGLSDP
nr:Gfo/Idh/MocA family oxidoreductase [Salsipaludibacter albus]